MLFPQLSFEVALALAITLLSMLNLTPKALAIDSILSQKIS
jgi:hypothetical protein